MASNVISGKLSPTNASISGKLAPADGKISGTLTRNKREPAPYYDGPYTVTPSQQTQVLPTELRTTEHDIVIDPIPSNYGLITWNGSVITVS